ncbi:MAG: bifunctional riboflavin kinase/FAD synthetase [Gammaproteobacteria bacterium]
MQLMRGFRQRHFRHSGCVATIGNFDGIHLGHQAVLGQVAEKASELGLPSVVITFEPHPQEFFRPDNAPMRLTGFREKMQTLRRYAVDHVLCLRFGRALADMPAQDFIREVLVDSLGVRCLVIGGDFRFGRDRKGDVALLQQSGFQVLVMRAFEIGGERVSSTRIRAALQQGDLAAAEKLLGRCYRLSGRVVEGDRRGRQLGYPTANIHMNRRARAHCGTRSAPVVGVFAVQVFGLEREPLPGIANIGTRPTVGGAQCRLEVHLLDFEGDLYGRHLQVEFLTRLRDEARFESLEALKQQIRRDEARAREFFERRMIEQRRLAGLS